MSSQDQGASCGPGSHASHQAPAGLGPSGFDPSRFAELRFVNSDARPKVATINCDTASVAAVMAWYGAFYAGDRYAVFADGEKLPKDKNGELIAPSTQGEVA